MVESKPITLGTATPDSNTACYHNNNVAGGKPVYSTNNYKIACYQLKCSKLMIRIRPFLNDPIKWKITGQRRKP